MKKIVAALICGVVLQIAQSAVLTLAVFSLCGLVFALRLIGEAGKRGVL